MIYELLFELKVEYELTVETQTPGRKVNPSNNIDNELWYHFVWVLNLLKIID